MHAKFLKKKRFYDPRIIEKTIQMIYSSPIYQEYLKKKTEEKYMKVIKENGLRRFIKGLKTYKEKKCSSCGINIEGRKKNNICNECFRQKIYEFLRQGKTRKEIAKIIGLSIHTIETKLKALT